MSSQGRPTVSDFRDATVRAFEFLRTEYAFRIAAEEFRALGPGFMADPVPIDHVPNARLGHGIVHIRFQSSTVAVEVSDDPRMETTCQLYRLGAPTDRVDLWHIRSFEGAGAESLYEWGRATMEEIVSELAGALSRGCAMSHTFGRRSFAGGPMACRSHDRARSVEGTLRAVRELGCRSPR